MSSPYEDDTFTEATDSQTQASVEKEGRKKDDLDHDDSLSRTHTSESQEHWSENVTQSPDRTSSTSENDRHLQVYSVSSIGESSSRSSLSSSGRIVEKWSHSSTTAGTTHSQDISSELPEESAVDRDGSYSEDFITTSATSVTEEDVRSDRSSTDSASVKEELEDEASDHHGDGYHGYSSDEFESSGGQSSATESLSAIKESEAMSNFLHRACQVVKQNNTALLDTEALASSSAQQQAAKLDEEDIEVTPGELLQFCSRKQQLLKEKAGPDAKRTERTHQRKQDTVKHTKGKIHRSHKPSSRSASQAKRCMRKEEGIQEGAKTDRRRHKRKQKLHEERECSKPGVHKAVVEIAPPQDNVNSSVDLVTKTYKMSSIDPSEKRDHWWEADSAEADSSVPQGLVDRVRLDTMMLDMKRGAKAKVHNPSTCRSCVKRKGALLQEEFLKRSSANVERKMIDAKVEQHLITHDSLTLIGEIARTLPRPTDDPNDVWERLMKGSVTLKEDKNNRKC
ncbi:uncharacterized protein LOC118431232 [Branchiostoma floridae]|uniref:Uncharacterized protein LOC118431232 n=1 Tax=Branchiostoma floridae TaxID=7739 RepID=A0A9J7MBJ9_BRAFL|nr:uncharacterized protein LOC118431232 [Branchiostoma floridae]